MAFPPLENSYIVVVSVSIDFLSNSKKDAPFHSWRLFPPAVWGNFVIIWEIFHRRIFLNLVLLLLLLNFVSIRPGLMYLHGFQLLVLLPKAIEITSFVCTNPLHLKWGLDRLLIVAKGFLKVPNLLMLIKQKNPETLLILLLANC